MGCLSIRAEVDPGSLVSEACEEAQGLADQLKMSVNFDFNDVHCCALPGGSAAKLIKNFWSEADSCKTHKFAFS